MRKPISVVALLSALLAVSAVARADDQAAAERVKVHSQEAMQELDAQGQNPPPAQEETPATALDPSGTQAGGGIEQLGSGRESGRDAIEPEAPAPATATACPEGQVPVLHDGQQVLGLDGQPACKARRAFVKGELTNLGATKLKLKDSRFGLRLGYARLDGSSYLSVAPEIDMAFGKFSFGLGLPLNIRAYANGFIDGGGVHLRTQDYNNPSDYAKIVRFLTYGSKEDNLYVNVSQLFAASIGHGAIVRRYSGNIDQNITHVGGQVDAYGKWGGFEAFVGDVVQPTHFMSGLVFVKPLGWLSGGLAETLGQTSLGVSYAGDAHAPFELSRIPGGYPEVDDKGQVMVAVERKAQLIGVDMETKIVKSEGADLKPYVDYSKMLSIQNEQGQTIAGGGGFTLGMLGRFNTGEVKLHAFRTVVEARYFDGNYDPSYFNTFYEVQKYQYITGRASTAYEPKLKTMITRDPSQKRAGFYVEGAYQYNYGLALMLAYENSFQVAGPDTVCPADPNAYCNDPNKGTQSLTAHIEYPAYSWLQFFASFYRRSFGGFAFDKDHILGDNTLIYAAARLHILPILFLNVRAYRSWQVDPVLGELKNVPGFEADLEFGYEFDRRKKG